MSAYAGITFAMHVKEDFPQLDTVQDAINYGEEIIDDKLKIVFLEISVIEYKKDLLLALKGMNATIIRQYQERLSRYLTALKIALSNTKDNKTFSDIGEVVILMAEDDVDPNKYFETKKVLTDEVAKLKEYSKKFEPVGAGFYARCEIVHKY